MLTQLHVSTRVRYLREISAAVFLTLYEGLCGEKLPGQLGFYMLQMVKFCTIMYQTKILGTLYTELFLKIVINDISLILAEFR